MYTPGVIPGSAMKFNTLKGFYLSKWEITIKRNSWKLLWLKETFKVSGQAEAFTARLNLFTEHPLIDMRINVWYIKKGVFHSF